MAGVQRNDINESPLWDLVQDGWVEWVQGIKSAMIREEDFLLYLVWALENIKGQGSRDDKRFRLTVYDALRNKLIDNESDWNVEDTNYVTNLVCACCLSCYGLTLIGSSENRDIYEDLVGSMGEYLNEVRTLKAKIDTVNIPELKDWVVAFMKNDLFYTKDNEIEWKNSKKKRSLKKVKQEEAEEETIISRRKKDPNAPMHLADDFDKADLFRVILGLYHVGAFESPKKRQLSQKAVFDAFGKMLGEDFGNYNNFLTDERYSELDIFREIQNAFSEYMKVKEKKRSSRK